MSGHLSVRLTHHDPGSNVRVEVGDDGAVWLWLAEGRLDAFFVEWMMGFPEGWVAGKCSRAQAIKRLGNAVVPQQGALALDLLLDWEASVAAARAHNERGDG